MTDAIKDPLITVPDDDSEQPYTALISSADSHSILFTPVKHRIAVKFQPADAEISISDLLLSKTTTITSLPRLKFDTMNAQHWKSYWRHFDQFLGHHPQHNPDRHFNSTEEKALRLVVHQIICAELGLLIDTNANTNKLALEEIENALSAVPNNAHYYREAFKNAVLKKHRQQTIAIAKDELSQLQASSGFVATYTERKTILQLQKIVKDYVELYPQIIKQYETALLQVNAIAIVSNQSSKAHVEPIITAQAIERALSSNNRYRNIVILIHAATQLRQLLGQDVPPLNLILQPAQWLANYPLVLQKIAYAIEQSVRWECELETEQKMLQLVQQKLAINNDYQNVLELYRQFKEMIDNLNHFEQKLEQAERLQQFHAVNQSTEGDEESDTDQSHTTYHG